MPSVDPHPPRRGDVFDWYGVRVRVERVARNAAWADCTCMTATGNTWHKRMPLPLPSNFRLVERVRDAG